MTTTTIINQQRQQQPKKSSNNVVYSAHLFRVVTIVSCTLMLCIVGFFVLLSMLEGSWSNWSQATCMPNDCFCEKPTGTLLQQPVNTFSNLAFCLTGVIVFVMIGYALDKNRDDSEEDYKNEAQPESAFWLYGAVYGMGNVFLGLGSGMYHASMAFVPQVMDNVGMYFIICWAFAYNMVRLAPRRVQRSVFFSVYLSMLIIFTLINIYMANVRRYAFFAMVLFYMASEYYVDRHMKVRFELAPQNYQMNMKVWVSALVSIAVGFVFWILDQNKILCNPTGYFQGHAVWHALCALSSWLLFYYYYAEKKKPALYSGDCSSNKVLGERIQSDDEVIGLMNERGHSSAIVEDEMSEYNQPIVQQADQVYHMDQGYVVNNHIYMPSGNHVAPHQHYPLAHMGAPMMMNPSYVMPAPQYAAPASLYPITAPSSSEKNSRRM